MGYTADVVEEVSGARGVDLTKTTPERSRCDAIGQVRPLYVNRVGRFNINFC